MTLEWMWWLDRGVVLLGIALALMGIGARLRRLSRLNAIILPDPDDPEDFDYLRSVKRSTYLRLAAKSILLAGGLADLSGVMSIAIIWRLVAIGVLVFMSLETSNVDQVRARLALHAQARRRTR